VLGATISGLVSRSILNDAVVGPGDFHACLYLQEFAAHDLSRWFVDEVYAEIERQAAEPPTMGEAAPSDKACLRLKSEAFLADIGRRYRIRNLNHVKPGIGEATRVLLRRVPKCLLVRDANAEDIAHLLLLAKEKGVRVIADAALPYVAAALIKELPE
jgi:hypothetical protein